MAYLAVEGTQAQADTLEPMHEEDSSPRLTSPHQEPTAGLLRAAMELAPEQE